MVLGLLLLALGSLSAAPPSPAAETQIGTCAKAFIPMDFAATTNPTVAMEWTDINGQKYEGADASPDRNFIPVGATDTTGGALPGGNVRFRNIGSHNGELFDLLVHRTGHTDCVQ
jgi:hypothetical protein